MRNALVLFVVLFLLPGCRADEGPRSAKDGRRAAPAGDGSARSLPRVVILGDSLTAGLGLPQDQAFPALLQRKIDAAGLGFEVINAGVSGDTTAGGLRRLDWVLDGDVRVLVVALGANDGLRGLPVPSMKRNLEAIVATARNRGIPVLIAGMEAPPNFGPEYTADFRRAFADVSRAQDVPLIPFLLEGVAGESGLNQGDGIHPNAEGAQRIAERVWRALEPMLVRR